MYKYADLWGTKAHLWYLHIYIRDHHSVDSMTCHMICLSVPLFGISTFEKVFTSTIFMPLMQCWLGFRPCNFHFSSRCLPSYFLLLIMKRNPQSSKTCSFSFQHKYPHIEVWFHFLLLSQDDDEGLHPAYIALIVVLGVLVLAAVVFALIWKFKIKPKSKTHGMLLTENSTSKPYYDICQPWVKDWLNGLGKSSKGQATEVCI